MEARVRNKVKWFDDDEEFRVGGAGGAGKGGLRAKPRFSFSEVKMLLESVMRNRFIILRKFNQGVSAEAKKQTWAEITDQINALGENHREVRQIMKKWADLKCDGKRRIAALRGPNGSHIRKKTLGPVEKMVHKILMMNPQGDGDSDLEFDDVPKRRKKNVPADTSSFSYLSLTENLNTSQVSALDFSPMSSPEKDPSEAFHSSPEFEMADDGDFSADFDDNDDSLFSSSVPPPSSTSLDPLPDGALARGKPVHTYSRNSQNQNSSKPGEASSSSAPPPPAAAPPPQSPHPPPPPPQQSPPPVSDAAAASSSSSSSSAPPVTLAAASSLPRPPPAPPSSTTSSSSSASTSSSPPALPPSPADALPAAPPSQRVAQMASQSLQQQRAGRMLLASVSQSLELLAQSVQLLVESQQEFVQESLLLQRETVDILRDFSATALAMLRDKGGSGALAARQHHPASHF